jgi:hypothetical protein
VLGFLWGFCIYLFYIILPLSVTLRLGVTTQFMRSSHRLVMVITYAKLFLKKISGLKLWSGHESVMDGQTDK